MSLRINKDNIYFILTEDRYSIAKKIDKHMAKDFSLYIKVKINVDDLQSGKDHFIFARNGMHAGISVFKNEYDKLFLAFVWYVKNKETEQYEYKTVGEWIDADILNQYNEYVMICDDENEKNIKCYFNNKLIGEIDFKDSEKKGYEDAFYWFGCGSMLAAEEEHMQIGDFNFETAFLINKKLDISEVNEISNNYESYTYEIYNGLRRLKDDFYLNNDLNNQRFLKDNFAFFCDFNRYTRYKIWDMTFSGNYPQLYMQGNIYF